MATSEMPPPTAPTSSSPETELLQTQAIAIERELSKVIVGYPDVLRGVLITLLAGGHALIEGAPGLGKTLLVRTLADVLDLTYGRIQCTPDLMPSDILGTNVLLASSETGERRFEFQSGPVFANGGHAGAHRDGGYARVPTAAAILRHRHAEPDRDDGYLPAA
ncbi:MAG: hypothetical protein E6I75_21150 [Chloroflexi bacterium]|nr:MAG: hypothetical protein E6I75_21150 [Chloroflexota bacterium]